MTRAELSSAFGGAMDSASVWRPLRTPIFRQLLVADVVSDIGTFMQSVGSAWLMLSLGAGPLFVALTQTASTLPFFLLALPAGSIGDIADRRKLILYTESWMVGVATVLAATTIAGVITPWLLLLLTFALSAGDAIEAPSWRAVLPELVHKEDLAAASALNAIEFNIARAIGPALAGGLIAIAGVGAAFVVNVISFAGVIVAVARWKRPIRQRTTPAETLEGATIAALRYLRNEPVARSVMLRAGAVMFCASGLFALLPTVAHAISTSATGYGVLLGGFGAGAVAGAVVMQRARTRWSSEAIVSVAVGILGILIATTAAIHNLPILMLILFASGGAWITFISLTNALAQLLAPDWVRARVLAMFMLVTQGGLAAGSVLWGTVGSRVSVEAALLSAGLATLTTTVLGLVLRLPDQTADLTSWNHWRMPVIVESAAPNSDEGPVLVTVEYKVQPEHQKGFLSAIHRYGRVRRRDGASRWGIFRDVERADVFVESFLVNSWAEHLRQHDRLTRADSNVEQAVHSHTHGEPIVRHFIYAKDGNGTG
jgi:MFS family permease